MRFDVITRDMIRPMYEQAANKAEQVAILAQLTDSTEPEIREILGLTVGRKVNKRKRLDEQIALELYKKGLKDNEIAAQCNVCAETVGTWRRKNGLIANVKATYMDHNKCMALYEAGASDSQIAAKMGVNRSTVSCWRDRNKLPNLHRPKPFCEKKARELYEMGWRDREIGKAIGTHPANVTNWRARNGLPAQCRRKKG